MSQSKANASIQIRTAEIVGIGKWLEAQLKEIDKDVTLSPQGKAQASQAARSKADEELAEVEQKHQGGFARLRADLQSTLDGKKPKRSEADRVRALGMYDSLDNRQLGLLIAETADVNARALRDAVQQIIGAGLDQKGFSAAMERAFNSGDQAALHNLSEVARFRGDQDGIKRAEGYLDNLHEQNMTPAQKIAKLELERLDLHEALFGQAIEFARKGGKALELLENSPVETERDRAIDARIQAIKLGFESKQTEGEND